MNLDKKIHILMISVDRNVLVPGSSVASRMEHYGSLVEGIDIISIGTRGQNGLVRLNNNVTVHPVFSEYKFIAALKALRLALKLVKTNTVIAPQDAFELGFIGYLASRISHQPLHIQVHIDFMSPYFRTESLRQRFQYHIAPFVIKRANNVRVVSQKIAQYVKDVIGIPAQSIVIAPIFVDSREVRNKPQTVDLRSQFKQFDLLVLVAARFVKQKNIPLAIEAFKAFVKKYPKAGLVLAGSGPEENEIKRIIREQGLQASVVTGSWTRDFISCMRTSDIFLMSSDYEGWGMTVIEAASLGKAVIMTDVGCAGEFLMNEKNGLIVPVRNATAISKALERYYLDKNFALKMGMAAANDADVYMTREESDKLMFESWNGAWQNFIK